MPSTPVKDETPTRSSIDLLIDNSSNAKLNTSNSSSSDQLRMAKEKQRHDDYISCENRRRAMERQLIDEEFRNKVKARGIDNNSLVRAMSEALKTAEKEVGHPLTYNDIRSICG